MIQIQLKSLAEEMQAVNKGLEKVEQELTTSENDGPVSEIFRKVITTATGKPLTFCQTLKDFLNGAEAKVRSLTSLYSNVVSFSPSAQISFVPCINPLSIICRFVFHKCWKYK
ncbi:hypothetical protein HU200_033590 [Digitaria exilis]|uniref:Uncharacterized protein n=1 Tax=Digitaria exilis TaxID=1010633 RepID=A0A835BHZ3_9POAL|nr:hypothetical protein HU200_033590 [Digitaria exilis]